MDQSLFFDEVKKYFPAIAARVVEKLNGSTNLPMQRTYLHRQMLTKKYSPSMRWDAITTVNGGQVAADVIAMDSSLPLKRRDSLSTASGDIPKMGLELALRERELTDLDILARAPGQTQQLLAKLFADTPKVINAVYETLEYMFLLGLSTGVAVIQDANNTGTGVRVDYKYLTENKFGVPVLWSSTSSTPLTDLSSRILEKARVDGNTVIKFMIDRPTFNNIAKTTEAKEVYAAASSFFGSNIPTPTLSQLNAATQDRYGFVFQIVERSVTFEKNGVRQTINPWAAGAVVGLTTDNVGTITYGTLAESNHPVTGVVYQTVDDYILTSKYRENKPSLAEFTSAQALVLPVIEGTNGIYLMDSTTVQA